MKSYGDTLVAIGQSLIDCEMVSYILANLSPNYDPLITSLTTWIDPLSLQEVYDHLLNYELCLKKIHATLDLPNAFLVNTISRNHNNRGRGQNSSSLKFQVPTWGIQIKIILTLRTRVEIIPPPMEATPPAKCAIGFYIMHYSVIIALSMLVKPNNLTNIKHFFTANNSPTDQA